MKINNSAHTIWASCFSSWEVKVMVTLPDGQVEVRLATAQGKQVI